MERLKLGRVLAKSLGRRNPGLQTIQGDPMVKREALRRRCRPYIFTVEEIERLLAAALRFPSPKAPLRPLTLYTMFVLAYCFVVRRMTEWYQQGVDPQSKLPYLWTYLGHRSLHSSLVYMTITQELLHRANDRFHAFAAPALRSAMENP